MRSTLLTAALGLGALGFVAPANAQASWLSEAVRGFTGYGSGYPVAPYYGYGTGGYGVGYGPGCAVVPSYPDYSGGYDYGYRPGISFSFGVQSYRPAYSRYPRYGSYPRWNGGWNRGWQGNEHHRGGYGHHHHGHHGHH